jgi:hypothetical protein
MDETTIKEKVSKLYDWNTKKEQKLKIKINEYEKKVDKICTFKPEVNKASEKLIKDSADIDLTERLYEVDIAKRKEKHKILESIYTHSFCPMTNSNQEKENSEAKKIKPKKEFLKNDSLVEKYKTSQNDTEIDVLLKEKFSSPKKFDLKLFPTIQEENI